MIYGIGTDICDIRRVQRLYSRYGQRFVSKILSQREERHMPTAGRAAWLAKRFAAKEAFAKALGTGFSEGLMFQDFTVLNNSKGAPQAVLSDKIKQKLPESASVHISLSDEKGYALAFIVIEQHTNNL